ncbi:beta-aspartyl-peptidase [Rheinheimera texasensis]|uniref:beta-aspartyl-peptidase n=1 Tax=Rheinheimera texasensis TaxID=306205 RepID=UPI0004E144F8|nr:beta-aspartyl-peptidase [Rheinheimera texasensis]
MITLIEHAEVFSPQAQGQQQVLVAGQRISAVNAKIDIQGNAVQRINATGCYLVPGLVDSLAHIIGGGGEGGFRTRTPELNADDAFASGVTTLVGVLGTDSITRTLTNLLAKAHALTEEGLNCYCHTGSYQIPVRTLFPTISEDLLLIDKFIGVGEVAIADHRSSQPTPDELKKLAAEARVGGMLSGKAGIVSVHVGPASAGVSLLREVAASSDIPLTQFYPTHMNRNQQLVEQGFAFLQAGGWIDFTTSTTPQELAAGEVQCAKALLQAWQLGLDCSRITFSSDANASLPLFDDQQQFIGLGIGRIGSLLEEVVAAVRLGVPLPVALSVATTNPARVLKLPQKGEITVGKDADLVLLDKETLAVRAVMSRGIWRYSDGSLPVPVQRDSLFV